MLVCIGSKALHYRNIKIRKAADIDLIGTDKDFFHYCKKEIPGQIKELIPIQDGKKLICKKVQIDYNPFKSRDESFFMLECELIYDGSTAKCFYDIVLDDPNTISKDGLLIPSIDLLYLLKMSHRYLKNSPFFLKTMKDILYLRKLGAQIPEKYKDFYLERQKETYNYSHPKLNQKKNDFFSGDGIIYVYDHDSIHNAIKIGKNPAYTYFKKPGSEVYCDKDIFNSLDKSIKMNAVLEEAYVLALERSQIPYQYQVKPEKSFTMALEKICTSITSGWFREFAWENYFKILSLYYELNVQNSNYVEIFLKQVELGNVILYNGELK